MAQTGEQYSFDADLSDFGRQQAQVVEEALGTVVFDRAYISPLRRARQTFEESNLTAEKNFFDIRLIELLPRESYESILPYEKLPDYAKVIFNDQWLEPLRERVKSFCDDLKKAASGNYLVIAHMGVISALLSLLTAENGFGDYYMINNCSWSQIMIDEESCSGKLIHLNETAHLERNGLI